jgi:hypothetical protein
VLVVVAVVEDLVKLNDRCLCRGRRIRPSPAPPRRPTGPVCRARPIERRHSGNLLDQVPFSPVLEPRGPAGRQRPAFPPSVGINVLGLNAAALRRAASSAVIHVILSPGKTLDGPTFGGRNPQLAQTQAIAQIRLAKDSSDLRRLTRIR